MTLRWNKLRQWGGNVLFTLFFLALMLDPTSTILHIKDKLFVLVVAYNVVFFRPSFRFFPHILLVYVAVACGFITGEMQNGVADLDYILSVCKAFAPLLLLLWAHHYDFVRLTLGPALVTALVACVIYGLCTYDEHTEGLIYAYMKEHDDTIMMSHRYLLGFKVFAIYYKSFVSLAFALFYFYYQIYNHPRRWYLTLLPVAILTFAFLVSGTRATMLLPFFVIVLVGYRSVSRMGRWRYALYPLIACAAVLFVSALVLFASETSEASNTIKYGHLLSFQDLFERNPLYLVFGQGVGTGFYSKGFHRMTNTTEWSYLELLRQYGLFCLPILFVLAYPFADMWRRRRDNFCFGIMGTYLAYLLVAGTNPLLIGSTGMIMILCAYSYNCVHERYDAPQGPSPQRLHAHAAATHGDTRRRGLILEKARRKNSLMGRRSPSEMIQK